MKTENMSGKYILAPLIVVSATSIFILLALWQSGLQHGFGKPVCWLFYLALFALCFVTLGIITIVRAYQRKKKRILVTILCTQLGAGAFFIPSIFNELSFRLNVFVYKNQREEIVRLIQAGKVNLSSPCIDDYSRKDEDRLLDLPPGFHHCVSMSVREGVEQKEYYRVVITRTSHDDTIIRFDMDEEFFGDKFAIAYFSGIPETGTTFKNGKEVKADLINGDVVERKIADHWYYIRVKMPGLLDGLFNFSSSSAPAPSPCGCE